MIYVGRRYTSRVTGSIVKQVACEKCRKQYGYKVTRQGVGQGSSPYYLNNAGAARRAEEGARRSLEKKLRKACEVVPCPACSWVQSDMVVEARRRRHRWMITMAIVVPIVAVVASLIAVAASGPYGDTTTTNVVCILVGMLGLALIPLRLVLNMGFDPNAGATRGAVATAQPVQPAVPLAPRLSSAPPPMPMNPSLTWYYLNAGQQIGPVTSQQIQGLVASGRLRPADLIWNDGMPDWAEAGTVAGLFAGSGAYA